MIILKGTKGENHELKVPEANPYCIDGPPVPDAPLEERLQISYTSLK